MNEKYLNARYTEICQADMQLDDKASFQKTYPMYCRNQDDDLQVFYGERERREEWETKCSSQCGMPLSSRKNLCKIPKAYLFPFGIIKTPPSALSQASYIQSSL